MDNVKFCSCIPTCLVMNICKYNEFIYYIISNMHANTNIFKPCRSMNDLTAVCKYS